MTIYHTFLDDSIEEGLETIQGIQNGGSEFGVGISSDIACNNLQSLGISTFNLSPTTLPTSNSSFSFELTDNATLTIRVKGTDGTVRVGIVTLT